MTAPLQAADTLPVFSDAGFPAGTSVFTWDASFGVQFIGKFGTAQAPEGTTTFRVVQINKEESTYAGWGVFYPATMNHSEYLGGELLAWIKTEHKDVTVEVEANDPAPNWKWNLGWAEWWKDEYLNKWVLWRFPLKREPVHNDFNIDFANIKSPFMVTARNGATFEVDQVRWVRPGATLPLFRATLRNVSDNSVATDLTWGGATPPPGWRAANQYIELELDPGDLQNWGVQIYTDNRFPYQDDRSKYKGPESTDPSGLIDMTDQTKRLPMCWRVVDKTTNTLNIVQGTDNRLYSQQLGGQASGFPCFHWLKDVSTPDIPATNTKKFVYGEDAAIVWDHQGMHYAEGLRATDPAYFGKFWGAVASPVRIYLGANFANAVTPRGYKTETLRLDLFSE